MVPLLFSRPIIWHLLKSYVIIFALIDQSRKILEGQVYDIKEQYKSNTFEVSFSDQKKELQNILGNNFNIVEERKSNGNSYAKVQLKTGSTQNDLLSKLIPEANILSFHEILPTMNEIFIQTVNQNTKKHKRHE